MPTSDPSITSESQRINQAAAIAQRVAATAGLYDRYQAEYAFLKAMKVTNIDKLLPDPRGPNAVPQPTDPKIQIEQMRQQTKQAEMDLTMKMGLLKLMSEAELSQAQIQRLEAEVEAIRIGIVTEGERMRIQEINMQIGLQRERREGVLSSIQTMNTVYDKMKLDLGKQSPEQPMMPQEMMPQVPPQ
jgi:hypothetical protein